MATDAQVEHLADLLEFVDIWKDWKPPAGIEMFLREHLSREEILVLAQYLIDNGAWEVPTSWTTDGVKPSVQGIEAVLVLKSANDKAVAKRKEMLG